MLPLIDRGRALIDLTYVGNVVDAILAAARVTASSGGVVFNITNGEAIRVAELLHLVLDAFGLKARLVPVPYGVAYSVAALLEKTALLRPGQPEPALTRYGVGLLGHSQTLSIELARQAFGYIPRVTLADGIARTAQAWKRAHA